MCGQSLDIDVDHPDIGKLPPKAAFDLPLHGFETARRQRLCHETSEIAPEIWPPGKAATGGLEDDAEPLRQPCVVRHLSSGSKSKRCIGG
jgi:hypothetical protein